MKRAVMTLVFAASITTAAHADTLATAKQAISAGNCDAAVSTLNELAGSKDAAAMNQLGGMYLVGQCVEKSNDEAKVWFEKAAAAGSLRAQKMLDRLNK
ncbi:hypothetical protein EZV61_03025 [Corallincola luteus]|uniref:Sel1 repeat family protein n=1 Tax=Corallincola luteus TaxID=1775177 RepID=A0ABY2APR6_9GAMM|nr:SEL1-like repeat protein [Corallincola luteus]TCI04951.1 hypothetical protein EZV61_03025 [Corallincola luteus]